MKTISSSRGWEYAYVRALKDRVERLRDSLEDCEGRDLTGYHFLCGQIRGIRVCIEDLTEVRQRFNVDDDKDLDSE